MKTKVIDTLESLFFALFLLLIIPEFTSAQKQWITINNTSFRLKLSFPGSPVLGDKNVYMPEYGTTVKHSFYVYQEDEGIPWFCLYLASDPKNTIDVTRDNQDFIRGLLDEVGGELISANYFFYQGLKTYDFSFFSERSQCNGRGRLIGRGKEAIVLIYLYPTYNSNVHAKFFNSLIFY